MSGDIILLKKIPNLNQSLFKGAKILEFNKPKSRKIREIITDQTLISSLWVKGYRAITKNTTKKTNPKLLFELTFISSI